MAKDKNGCEIHMGDTVIALEDYRNGEYVIEGVVYPWRTVWAYKGTRNESTPEERDKQVHVELTDGRHAVCDPKDCRVVSE